MHTINVQLEQVFSDDTYQLTGVAVSKDGRVFTCYPLWPGPHKYDVVEILPDNKVKPFPDEHWNSWKEGDDGKNKWVKLPANFPQPIYILAPPTPSDYTTKLFSAVKKQAKFKIQEF